jgi:hypothetical protein
MIAPWRSTMLLVTLVLIQVSHAAPFAVPPPAPIAKPTVVSDPSSAAVPEPAAYALTGCGLIALSLVRRRK